MEKARVAVVELTLDGQTTESNLIVPECSSPTDLKNYLENSPGPDLRRVFIVEWSPHSSRFPGPDRKSTIRRVLEAQLDVPAELFQEHAVRGVGFEPREEHIVKSYLPTARFAEQRWCLTLFDLLEFTGTTESLQFPCSKTRKRLRPGDAGLTLVCEATERQLQFHWWRERQRWLIIAPRRCSYWSRRHKDGWDVVILCDPSPDAAKPSGSKAPPVSLRPRNPFLNGYHEFIPHEIAVKGTLSATTRKTLGVDDAPAEADTGEGIIQETRSPESEASSEKDRKRKAILSALESPAPPRTSLFDDLRYYFSRHSGVLSHPATQPWAATLFPLKLVASHLGLLHSFVAFQTASMRSIGWAVKRETPQQIDEAGQVENAWSHFRCSEYLEAIEALLDTLGIPYGSAQLPPSSPYNPGINRATATATATVIATAPRQCPNTCCSRDGAGSTDRLEQDDSAWKSAAADFLYLHRQFSMRRLDYDRITTSIAALSGIITGRLAVDEATTAKSLTYVAMLFAPLAWVAAVYALPEELGPGRPLFWRYWATALPVTALVWLMLWGWHHWGALLRVAGGARAREKRPGDMV